ncbi:unnamed protein product, partial [Cylindrotheca closterium]
MTSNTYNESSSSNNTNTNTTNNNNNKTPVLDLGEIGVGLMQWGTTKIDERVVNPKGNLSDDTVQEL